MDTTVALTGASGFIGGVIAQHLRKAGWHVRGLARSPRQAQELENHGIEPVQGNLENPASLLALVDDSVGVIHCAGAIRGVSREDFYRTNVMGVSNMIQACLAQSSLPRFVLLSSLAAREPSLSPYAWSKHEGESVLTREAGALKWSIFRPPAVYGPQDRALLPLFEMLRKGIGIQLGPSQAKFSLIHVDDLANAILHWLKNGDPPFQTFEIDDGFPGGYSWSDVFRLSNPRLRLCLRIPPIMLKILGKSNERLSRLFGYAPLFTSGKVAELLHLNWVCDSSHMTQTLGWTPQISLKEGLRRLFTSDRLMPSHRE
jgi:nucleoside-diphosphate-sugar epimerase